MSDNLSNAFNFQFTGSRIKMLSPLAPIEDNRDQIDFTDGNVTAKLADEKVSKKNSFKSMFGNKNKKNKF